MTPVIFYLRHLHLQKRTAVKFFNFVTTESEIITPSLFIMSGKRKVKTKKPNPLPKNIRDEIRMSCVLKGFSKMKCGQAKRLVDQYDEMQQFYHGYEPSHPSQIKLLSEAHINYRDMYDEITVPSIQKSDNINSTHKYRLKKILTQDLSRDYYSGHDIRSDDLEKKNRTGSPLITGRNLHAMAIRGVKCYKKALSFVKEKWDMERNEPIHSGDTLEDCIEHVRVKMHYLLVKPKGTTEDSETDSESEELGDVDEMIAENVDGGVPKNAESTTNSEEEAPEVPAQYLFPSFFAFLLWGPFAPEEERISLFLTDDKGKKKGNGNRESKRDEDLKRKLSESHNDNTAVRGFTTEQRIDIETLNVHKQGMIDRQNEAIAVGLAIESGALDRLVEAAERRAEARCPQYDDKNTYWQRVDHLLVQQDSVLQRIQENNQRKVTPLEHLSPFLNQPSPKKAKSCIDIADEPDGTNNLSSTDGDDHTSNETTTLKSRVSSSNN